MVTMTFATPANWEAVQSFGCATLYFANTQEPVATAPIALAGTVLHGTYEKVLEECQSLKAVQAAVVLFGNAGGENAFLQELQQIHPCPMVGGGAAFADKPGLITGGGAVAVFFIQDERYRFVTQTQCIHTELIDTCELTLEDSRTIASINGQNPAVYLKEKKTALGLPETDFEHLTLTDKLGVNAHLSCVDGKIKSGRDLHAAMDLRFVPHQVVYDRIRAFYDDKTAVIFGCAGLGGLLDKPLDTDNLGLFLFGEVCTVEGKAEFGNLMLSKLQILPKE